jgi:hypothetical protein
MNPIRTYNISDADMRALINTVSSAAAQAEETHDRRLLLDPAFRRLVKQQLDEIAHVARTFDFSSFAGAQGPLSGSGCRPTHRKLPAASAGLNPRQVAAQHLRGQGYSLGVIARALGVSKTHVARLCAAGAL